ncbi:MAG: hypothetical protein Q4B68_10860 [Bacteroidales bacterium]|nr:hypothetical protein [Bacteroidales bacterium]
MKKMKWMVPLVLVVAVAVALLPVASCAGGSAPHHDSIDTMAVAVDSADTLFAPDTADTVAAVAVVDSVTVADSIDSIAVVKKAAVVERPDTAASIEVGEVFDDFQEGHMHHCMNQGPYIVAMFLIFLLTFTMGIPLILLLITHLIDKSRRNAALHRFSQKPMLKKPLVNWLSVLLCIVMNVVILVSLVTSASGFMAFVLWLLYVAYLSVNFFRAIFRKL